MRFAGRVATDRPDPAEEWRARATALGVRVAGFVPQRHLEDWGVSGVMSSSSGGGAHEVLQAASFPRSYTVWRNPDDRADPVNLADLSAELRLTLNRAVPTDLPAWIVRARERMRYPTLWEAVQTHWFAVDAEQGPGEERTIEELLRAHAESILLNRYRDELGFGDMQDPPNPVDLVPRNATQASEVTLDGVRRPGVQLDTDPFVFGLGTALDDGRIVTAVIPRDLLDLVTVEFDSDAG